MRSLVWPRIAARNTDSATAFAGNPGPGGPGSTVGLRSASSAAGESTASILARASAAARPRISSPRCLEVDDGELGAARLGEHREAGGGIDDERRAEDDEEVASERRRLGPRHLVARHRLAERDGCRLDQPAAIAAGGNLVAPEEALLQHRELVAQPAIEAGGIARITVQLDD